MRTDTGARVGSLLVDHGRVRHTEFWARMNQHLGESYAPAWADQMVIGALEHRTVREALDAGVPPKEVWRAVWEILGLPASER